MYIQYEDKNLHLNDKEVESCRRIIAKFIESVRDTAKDHLSPSYYFTLLLTGHIMFKEMLDDFDTELLEKVLNTLKTEEAKPMTWRIINGDVTVAEFSTNHSISLDDAIKRCEFEKLGKVNIDDPDYKYEGKEYWYDDLELIQI